MMINKNLSWPICCVAVSLLTQQLGAGEQVTAELFVLPASQAWPTDQDQPSETFKLDAMAFPILPRLYSDEGLIVDRKAPFVLRLSITKQFPEGDYELLVRAMNRSRLLLDGKPIAKTAYKIKHNDGHNEVPELTQVIPNLRMLAPGHGEQVVSFRATGKPQQFVVEVIVGGKKKRTETGELCLCIRRTNSNENQFLLINSNDLPNNQHLSGMPLTDQNWEAFFDAESQRILEWNRRQRQQADSETEYWANRHLQAKAYIDGLKPLRPKNDSDRPVASTVTIDHFVQDALPTDVSIPDQLDDYQFLRRLSLDTIGVIPSMAEIQRFMADSPETRRATAVDRFLADDRWADHWVSYWQDVLAENPGILKPKLNNTGPFRWWVYESFLDNKPIDRFASELIMMRGSKYAGGPAGFSMATQNDAPMAAKAPVIGQAFLGVQMKCARCHDAPQHDFRQEQLFNIAAMLNRKPQRVPESSSIPTDGIDLDTLSVQVSLKPGSDVAPVWPFTQLEGVEENLPEGILRNENDSRERLAAIVTSYSNLRFAKVIVNRLWHRLLGQGIVDSVDDWEHATSHAPELLEFLARQLVANGYDLKHVARLILNSHTYQAKIVESDRTHPLFPVRRRQTAEQLVDSLFSISSKPFKSEMLNLDLDGQRPVTSFINLGIPKRAWEFTSLSNERDRPALAMPRAQSIVDMLLTFGWRDSRQDPITSRDAEPTVQQPGIMANGVVVQRTACLSDDHHITDLCHHAETVEAFVEQLYLQVLSRSPKPFEREQMIALLEPGFKTRIVKVERKARSSKRHAVSWSNHLNAEATRIKLEEERQVQRGDPPTATLQTDWRERVEDVVWALLNSPEFVFLP